MIKVLVLVVVWLVGMMISVAASDEYTKVEPIAYAYSCGFVLALLCGMLIMS